ncbi:MAG TPA: glycosyltransferase, partial [Candidatus Cloacimonadota bacterium]|nr:glycosyltransferase [Candidatus Cloacimonadota bacterium]
MKLRTYIFITLNRIFWNLGALIKIISINPDLIIGRDPNTLLISYVASKLLNKPIIYEPHEIWDSSNLYLRSTKPMQVYWNLVEKLLIKKVNITFTTTESKRKILSERYGVDNVYVLRSTSPFRELRHSINLKKQYNIPEDKLLLIYHGQLGRIRGVFDLVDAIKDLDDYVLLFMGMGNDIYELMQYVKQLSLNHKIFFKDAVNPDDIVENIASADIGIQPFHYSENIYNEISNKLLECIMAELPTIGVDFPEIKRIIIGENIGFVYKSGDIKQLKIVLQEIAQNRCILNKFKENCRNIKHQYSWEIDEKILLEKVRTLI